MARKTPVDKLNAAISGILEQYQEDLQANVGQIAEQMGKKGVQALRQASRTELKGHTGNYSKGWKMQVERERLKTTVTIYNEHPALPHLLEYGHVTRNGTGREYPRTPAHQHIKPVADELIEKFEQEVVAKL